MSKQRSRAVPPSAKAAALDRYEWEFTALTEKQCSNDRERAELRAAIYYEYARESDSIRGLVSEYAALPKKLRGSLEKFATCLFAHSSDCGGPVSQRLALLDFIPFKNCILWPEFFPQTPWLKIPKPKRIARIAQYVKARSPENLLQINEHDPNGVFQDRERPVLLLKKGRHRKKSALPWRCIRGGVEHLLVSINWQAGNDSDISAMFLRFLKETRPEEYPEPRTDASRENVTAAMLERLKVMRLCSARPWKDIEGIVRRRQSDAGACRKVVRRDMRRIFQSDGVETTGEITRAIPEAENPRSYSTYTEQKRMRKI